MFTGIIEQRGIITKVQNTDFQEILIQVSVPYESLHLGESIAVNGVCLTVAGWRLEKSVCTADFFLSSETLDKTCFREIQPGKTVHLERAATPTTALSGHWVQGHVDGLGKIKVIQPRGDSWDLFFDFPERLAPYFVEKGSVTLNGVSLTLNTVGGTTASVRLIPHTWKATTFSELQVGDSVHLEADILAKYVEKQLEAHLKSSSKFIQLLNKPGNDHAQLTSNH